MRALKKLLFHSFFVCFPFIITQKVTENSATGGKEVSIEKNYWKLTKVALRVLIPTLITQIPKLRQRNARVKCKGTGNI